MPMIRCHKCGEKTEHVMERGVKVCVPCRDEQRRDREEQERRRENGDSVQAEAAPGAATPAKT